MALNLFYEINLPYVMQKADDGGWVCFNREYQPLGNSSLKINDIIEYTNRVDVPKSNFDDNEIEKIVRKLKLDVIYDDNNKIQKVFFYNQSPEKSYLSEFSKIIKEFWNLENKEK